MKADAVTLRFSHSCQMEICQLTLVGITISHLFLWWPGEMWALEGTRQPWRALMENDSTQNAMVFSNLGKPNSRTWEYFLSTARMKPICHLPYSPAAFRNVHFWPAGILCFQLIFTVQLKDLHGCRSFINCIYGHSQSQSRSHKLKHSVLDLTGCDVPEKLWGKNMG